MQKMAEINREKIKVAGNGCKKQKKAKRTQKEAKTSRKKLNQKKS